MSLVIAICMLIPLFAGCTGLGGPPEPTARIKADREEINVGESVNFDARESSSPDGTIVTNYKWKFGDGKSDETTQGYTSHTFTEPGYYEVEVTAVNDEGGEGKASTNLFVNGYPEISLTKPTAIRTGDMITLDASGSSDPEGSTLTFTWILNWISEEESQSMNSIYTFVPETSGNYSGTVTVADEKGATASQAWTVAVLPRSYQIIWEEHTVSYTWDGTLEQGDTHNESVIPSEERTGIIMSVDGTLTLAMDFLIQAPQDNFTLTVVNSQDGWKQKNSTQQENITRNSTTRIFQDNFNSIPNAAN
ncbi:MAG: PKD domain-containing protein, partial [Candidatus Thermoplasmatota archaeon]|nr:PKD domain-containing protein [Candidatus Thermoplasmatota archaeon]